MTVIERKPNKPALYYEQEQIRQSKKQKEKEEQIARVRNELNNIIKKHGEPGLSEYAKGLFDQQIVVRIKELEALAGNAQEPPVKERTKHIEMLEIELKSFKDLKEKPNLSDDLRETLNLEVANREHQLEILKGSKEGPLDLKKVA